MTQTVVKGQNVGQIEQSYDAQNNSGVFHFLKLHQGQSLAHRFLFGVVPNSSTQAQPKDQKGKPGTGFENQKFSHQSVHAGVDLMLT